MWEDITSFKKFLINHTYAIYLCGIQSLMLRTSNIFTPGLTISLNGNSVYISTFQWYIRWSPQRCPVLGTATRTPRWTAGQWTPRACWGGLFLDISISFASQWILQVAYRRQHRALWSDLKFMYTVKHLHDPTESGIKLCSRIGWA